MNARPFLKWAGGKTQLISDIENALPKKFVSEKFTYIRDDNFFDKIYDEFNIGVTLSGQAFRFTLQSLTQN